LPSLTVTATPAVICTGASSTLSATGATTYTWSANAGSVNTSTATVSPTVNSTYTVSASKNGCSNSATVAVSVGPPPTVSVTATQTTICAGNSTTLTGAGAGTYTWMPGGSTTNPLTVSPTVTTTYSVMGSSGGCKDSATITIHVNPGPAVTAVASQTAICSGQSSTLTASGAPNYTWSANAGSATTSTVTVSPSSTATYVVTGDSSGCQTSYSVVVNVTPTPTVLVIAPTTTLCSGGSLPILAGGSATTFMWSANAGSATTSTVIVSPTVTTTYSVVGATGSCTGSGSVTINVTTTPTVIASSPAPVCQGQSATMVATVSPTTSTLLWSPGGTTNDSLTVSLSTTTNYSVIASNGACSDTAYATVTINPTPTLSISSPSTQTACAGTNVTGINFTSSTGAVVGWSNSNTNIGLVSNGTGNIAGYTAPGVTSQQSGVITVAAANPVTSCASVPQTFTITINPSPNLSGTASVDSALCGKPNGAVKNLTASGGTSPLTYQWYLSSVPVPGATSANLTGVPIGVYSLIVTDASGCSVTSFTYSVPGSPAVAAAFSANTYHGTASLNVTFTNGSTGASAYSWNFGTGSLSSAQNPTFTYNTGGTYQVILTASHGTCSDTAMRTIIVDQPIEVTVPNIFSPNGDNINDEFFIVTSGVTELNCEIFNRWGQKVFTLSSPTQKWDGKLNNGNTATEGTYYYMLNAKSYDGKQHILQGPITLVK
jgi:gliding motility-associated-like protein